MKFRWLGRWNRAQRLYRMFSVLWGTDPRDAGYMRRLSVSLRPALFSFHREFRAWFLTVAGVRLHFKSDTRGTLV